MSKKMVTFTLASFVPAIDKDHSQVVRCILCKGTYQSYTRVSPRRAVIGDEDGCSTANSLHQTCGCPLIILDGLLNPTEAAVSFCRQKCCQQGMGNRLLRPNMDKWIDLQIQLDAPCPDCPEKGKFMRRCNSHCCSAYTSACYTELRDVLELDDNPRNNRRDGVLDASIIRGGGGRASSHNKKLVALKRLLSGQPITACLNLFGFEAPTGRKRIKLDNKAFNFTNHAGVYNMV